MEQLLTIAACSVRCHQLQSCFCSEADHARGDTRTDQLSSDLQIQLVQGCGLVGHPENEPNFELSY